MHTRTSEAHTDVPPREHDIAKQMTKRFVAKRHDICSVLPFLSPPRSGRIGRSTRPVLETPLCDATNLRLIGAVHFVFTNWTYCHCGSGPSTTLACIATPTARTYRDRFRTFLLGIEIMVVSIIEELGPTHESSWFPPPSPGAAVSSQWFDPY